MKTSIRTHEGRVALVTGAAQGIGQAIALALAERGAQVVATDLKPPHETVGKIGPTAYALELDVTQEEAARHRVSGAMMRLAPSADMLGKIARLLEEGTIRPDVASVYALQDAAEAWKDIAGNLPAVHGMSPSWPGAARRRSHGKIVLRVA